jgi:hypothetical protein
MNLEQRPHGASNVAAMRLFWVRAAVLSTGVAYSLAMNVSAVASALTEPRALVVVDSAWFVLDVAVMVLTGLFARAVAGSRASSPALGAFVASGISVLFFAIQLLEAAGGPRLLHALGTSHLARLTAFALSSVAAFTADALLWVALERSPGAAVTPVLRLAFWSARPVGLAFSALGVLSFETYLTLMKPPFGAVVPWLRLAFSVLAGATMLVALSHLARATGTDEPSVGEQRSPGEQASRDLWIGALWLGGGLLITIASYNAAAGGGGRFVVTTGAIVYGIVRIVRGGMRRLG